MFFDHVEIAPKPANERRMVEYLAYGFQYHHIKAVNWNTQDLLSHGNGKKETKKTNR